MNSLKKSIVCVLIGLVLAIVSCSAVRMAKRNIQIQSQDSTFHGKGFEPPASVPAMAVMPIKSERTRADFRPLKDSLFNSLKATQNGVNINNQKLDSVLRNQLKYGSLQNNSALTQNEMINILKSQNLQIVGLNKKLTSTSNISTGVKNDAIIGTTILNIAFGLLIFIAVAVILIGIGVAVLYGKATNHQNVKHGH